MNYNVFAVNKQLKELDAEKLTLIAQLATAQKDLAAAQDTIGVFMTEKATFDKQLADMADGHAKAIEALTADFNTKLQASEAKTKSESISTDAKAAVKLASIGVSLEELEKVPSGEQLPTTKGYKIVTHIAPK